jgi:NAD(P)-dependent dehydrogenase (short-subunit alcohol dehydrogenase family)
MPRGAISKELRGRNITVNTVAPGPTATNLFLKGKSSELIDRLAKLAPLPGSTARHCGSMAALSKNHIPSVFGT